ncbi:MAG: hypothetical protein WC319_12485 [Candidatus Paceibacterota bacterium]|jgi:hypothetical protein
MLKMLIKTNQKDKKGKDLYQNALTGEVITLGMATFWRSDRKDRRAEKHGERISASKNTGEMFRQVIRMGRRTKVVMHYTNAALVRKAALTGRI